MIIAACNSKGGCAKSTFILILADAIARSGTSVTIVDTDVQRSIANWQDHAQSPEIRVIEETNSLEIHKVLRAEAQRSTVVLVDMAGFTTDMRTPVISRADLVVIPMQPSPEDARLAATAFGLIKVDEETLGRSVKKAILWARTVPNFETRIEKRILEEMERYGVPQLRTHLSERSVYKGIFMDHARLSELDPVRYNGLEKAVENADRVALEVLQTARDLREKAA